MTKSEILSAAAQLISEKGFHAASMQDIADAVNIRKASLYHHVSSKQEILVDLLDNALGMLTETLSEITAQPISPEEKLNVAVNTYLTALIEHREVAGVLLFEHRSLNAEMRARHVPQRDAFEALWRTIIREGIEAGTFTANDPSIAAKTLLGTMNWFVTWFDPDGPKSVDEIADCISSLFLYGLVKREIGSS